MTFFSQARRTCGTTHFIRPCTILHTTGFGLPPYFEDWVISLVLATQHTYIQSMLNLARFISFLLYKSLYFITIFLYFIFYNFFFIFYFLSLFFLYFIFYHLFFLLLFLIFKRFSVLISICCCVKR